MILECFILFQETLTALCITDIRDMNSPDRASSCSSNTVAYLSSDDGTMDLESPYQEFTSMCEPSPCVKNSLTNSTVEDFKPVDTNCKFQSFAPDLTVPAKIPDETSVSHSIGMITSTPTLSSSSSCSATHMEDKSITMCYPLPAKFRYRNVSNVVCETNAASVNIPSPPDETLKPEYCNTKSVHKIVSDMTAGQVPTSTIGHGQQNATINQCYHSKNACRVHNNDKETVPKILKNSSTPLVCTVEDDVPALQLREANGARDLDQSISMQLSVKQSDVHKSINGCYAPAILVGNSTSRQIEHSFQSQTSNFVKTASFESGYMLDSNNCHVSNHGMPNSDNPAGFEAGQAKKMGKRLVEKSMLLQHVSVGNNGVHETEVSSSSRQLQLSKMPSNYSSGNVHLRVTLPSLTKGTSGRSVTMTKILDRAPPSIEGSAPQGTSMLCSTGMDIGQLGRHSIVSLGESRFGSASSLAAFGSQLPCTFVGSAPNNVGSSLQGISTGSIGSLPRIDSMLVGLPLISGIMPNNMPWPPRLGGSIRPLGYSLLPSDTGIIHFQANSHARSVTQTALDYVSHLRPNCGLSPLVLHSPQSMSPQIPQPYNLPKLTSSAPPTTRLSISIPPPSPSRGSKYQRQPLGDGILTTQPPGNLFLVTPSRTAVASAHGALTVGSLMGSAAFHWPRQPPVVQYGR